jgi:hypothetical protein
MSYLEYIVVGLLVAAAAVYAFWRLRRALKGREGCSFMSGDGPPCEHCPGACSGLPPGREEANGEVKGEE